MNEAKRKTTIAKWQCVNLNLFIHFQMEKISFYFIIISFNILVVANCWVFRR
jgi:ABC-type lipoprotein release transport system permease subunit